MKLYCVAIALLFLYSCKENNNLSNNHTQKDTIIHDADNAQIKYLSDAIAKDSTQADLFFTRANLYLQDTMIVEAVKDLRQAIHIDSSKTAYRMALSEVYFQSGELVYAIEEAKIAHRINNLDIDIKNRLAKYFMLTKGYENALKLTKDAHIVAPQDAESYFIEGMIYYEMQLKDKAIGSLKKCIEQDPEYIDALMQLATIYNRDKSKEAIRYYDYVIRIDSMNMLAHYGKAMYYQDNKEYDAAKKVYRNMIVINKNATNAYYNLGYIYMHQDSIDIAIRQFEIAIRVAPTYADAYYMRGLCYEAKKDYVMAKVDYKQCLTFKEDHTQAKGALKRIDAKL